MESPIIKKKPFAILFMFIGVVATFFIPLEYLDRIKLFSSHQNSEFYATLNQFSGFFVQIILVFVFGVLGFLFGMGIDYLVNKLVSPKTSEQY